MDIKSRFNKIKQLDKNTSRLVIAVSCIALSLLIVYFGVSLTSKGTFSAASTEVSNYVCSDGTLVTINNVHLCCPSGYNTANPVIDSDPLNSLTSNGYVCTNEAWVLGSYKHRVRDGVGYCGVSTNSSNPVALCEFQEDDMCFTPCAANTSVADLYSCSILLKDCTVNAGTTSDSLEASVSVLRNGAAANVKYYYNWHVNGMGGYGSGQVTHGGPNTIYSSRGIEARYSSAGDIFEVEAFVQIYE